ncbi:Glycosyl transferase, family 2 [Nostoc sp. NIES-3756]|uniref:hormogonium polysaccharide biosynthesis glycosyltransferase HpsE n=1 Tax=Nostoc sp. NIES-3756 TaxID=1751286 RepID=UPI0007214086|nr:hormogonium polysaccharide biosynthesis glycosyltransferase HpsE [Nostoc sp. NIES-3756]BAT53437.1 Glycosyl transferase, family 2 [Nostoc sp. NIES-3756]BAY38826.1 family 2 glycosyl transferase [Nostoc sp. NIES-2111]
MVEQTTIEAIDFSVAICTYNGANRLPAVLDRLYNQIIDGIKWEVLVVDNNSSDDTKNVVMNYANNWRQDCQLSYVFESTQGASFARQKAVQMAQSQDLIGFLDDDNWPSQTWVAEAYKFGQEHQQAGAYGGIIHAHLDEPPPDYFDRIQSLLAVHHRGSKAFQYERSAKPRKVPTAPGCVIRKQAWRDAIPERLLLTGRDQAGKTMLGVCEDLEKMYYIQNSDWEVWHNPQMEIWHHIPSRRLERDYLLRVARTSGLSNYALRIARLQTSQKQLMPILTPLYMLSDGYKVISYYLKYRQHFADDIAKACEFESRLGKFLSPFVWLF